MRTHADLHAWAAARYRNGHREWLSSDDLGESVEAALPLQPPTEATAGANPGAVATWVKEWRSTDLAGVDVEWAQKRWTSLGVQELPARARVRGASNIASLAGERAGWRRLTGVASRLRASWPDSEIPAALPGMAGALRKLDDADVDRLVAIVNWFRANPGSGLLSRQVAVTGVDTKWLEHHQGLVERLVVALTGAGDLGLRKESRRFRVRVLDSTVAGGLLDFTAPTSELAGLGWKPDCVLVCENAQCVAALPAIRGVVAVHGNGYAAAELAGVAWISRSRVLYWGDLDSHGFAILGRLRAALPQVESLMMDEATWTAFKALAVAEPQPFKGLIGHLTASEHRALTRLRAGDHRLEQERIDWDHAMDVVMSSIAEVVSS